MKTDRPRVLITGIGVISAIGCGREAFWDALASGASGVTRIAEPPGIAAPAAEFAPRQWIKGPGFRRMDRLSKMLVAAAAMALDDAGVEPARDVAPERVGLTIGTALGNASETTEFLSQCSTKGPRLASPFLFPNLVMNAPTSYAALEFNATGRTLTVSEGDLSGELAIALGHDLIATGAADLVLAGGVEEMAPVVQAVYRDLGLVTAAETPDDWGGPLDRVRTGTVLGEGAAVVVLENERRVRRHDRHGYAEMTGYRQWAVAAPAHGWPRETRELAAAIRTALEMLPGRVDGVYGAASGARDRDGIELDALAEALGSEAAQPPPWFTTIKGATGDFGAAGAMTVAAAALSIATGQIAPLCRIRRPPRIDRLRLAGAIAHPAALRRVLVHGLARGGNGIGILLAATDPRRGI